MAVSADTAEGLIRELYLVGRAMRLALLHPEEDELLPGAVAVLGILEAKGPSRQGDLAIHLCISPSVLSRQVAELVRSGFISRHADPDDGRANVVQVTEAGRDLLHRVRLARARGLQAVLSDWSEDEAEQARATVQNLKNALTTHVHHTAASHRPVSSESQEVNV
ncbi:MarR family winged helix-turn-helix transcriptional regulator [Nocardia goodfellowii]|uniref:DNA-binding MarR family transcriptional regulator n=1 Tax=Nocardia goodfellowii TaxID=882446 RepID=A0ABS4QH16_9NOCA|nr:MarR family transcriptional regulator [Nocardia goodfellowii]MBP2191001.1 DNA-binding MarR family transcriptional regulator [Nocardia goodfellowii]